MSDLEDFQQHEAPKGKKSRLDPYAKEIFALRGERYTLDQIRRYLSEKKGVRIARQNLHLWIKRREGTLIDHAAGKKARPVPEVMTSQVASALPAPVQPEPEEKIEPTQSETERGYGEALRAVRRRQQPVSIAEKLRERTSGEAEFPQE